MSANSADVTIRDVASLAGVSPMTVSRVINESDRVSPDTQRRVEKAIAELGYIPSRLARGLSARRTGTLAVIVPDVANPFFTMVVRAAEDVARRSAYRVILCDTRADLAVERDVIEELIAHRVEGIAIAPVSDRSKPHLARLARFRVPFVLIDRTVAGIECDAVVGDSVGGAQQLVEHLIQLGHRRIGLIVEADEVSSARERRQGYESALRAAGLPLDPALVEVATPDPDGGLEAMGRLLSSEDRPSAVFAVNNLVAGILKDEGYQTRVAADSEAADSRAEGYRTGSRAAGRPPTGCPGRPRPGPPPAVCPAAARQPVGSRAGPPAVPATGRNR